MQYRTLGRTGLNVSEIGFGGAGAGLTDYIEAWDAAGAAEARSVEEALHRALDRGINYLDTAPGYGGGISETLMGRVIRTRREECIVATKTGAQDPKGIRESVEASLKRLQTDAIDVIQFHGGRYAPREVERILSEGGLETFERLREEGKVRYIGFTTEGPSPGVSQLIATGRFDVMQARYNLMYQDSCDFVGDGGIIREAKLQGMGIVTMRSLTSGIFQTLMRRSFPQSQDIDWGEFLLNYNLSNPLLDVVLVGMRRKEEVEKNAALSDRTDLRWDLAALHSRYV